MIALPEDARRKRNRQVNISIQMTTLTWLLELVTGIVALSVYFIVAHDDSLQAANTVLVLLTHSLHFIIIPSAYNLNTRVVKECIMKHGWLRSFHVVVPENNENDMANENDDTEFDENDHPAQNSPPLQIRTSSGDARGISVSKKFNLEVVSVE